jgi:DNA primase
MNGLADEIAQQYLKRVRIKDDFIAATCPFHKEGRESRPSFWVNRQAGNWGCFTCGKHGGGLKWLLKELGVSTRSIEDRLEIAEKDAKKTVEVEKARARKRARKPFAGEHTLPDALLGVFDFLPLDLTEAGFSKDVLHDHEIGFDRRNNRITFPIRDLFGNLIGISGRATMIGEEPKYLVYSGRRVIEGREVSGELGEWYPDYTNEGVRDHLWRMDKCYERLMKNEGGQEQLIIVEGYKAALWLVQHGWVNTVALMGARMSPNQERIVRSLGVETFVFLDNNRPGREGSARVCQRLAVSTFPVYEVSYPEDCDDTAQPDDLIVEELEAALNHSRRVGGKRHDRRDVRCLGRQSRGRPAVRTQRWG